MVAAIAELLSGVMGITIDAGFAPAAPGCASFGAVCAEWAHAALTQVDGGRFGPRLQYERHCPRHVNSGT
jgi:hypothetical protein